MTDNCILPEFDIDEAAALARQLYGLDGPIRQLDGERDLNFLVGEKGARVVFKIANAAESPAMLECQHRVFEKLAAARVFPATVKALESVNGKSMEPVRDAGGRSHVCRALPYVEGRLLREIENPSLALLGDIGSRLASLDRALEDFSHPALERPLLWKMDSAPEIVDTYSPLLGDTAGALVEHFAAGYRHRVLPRLAELRRRVIHNDANRANLVIDESGSRLLSIIDFGDMVNGWLVVDPSIAATYVMLDRRAPLEAAAALFAGYREMLPLRPAEIETAFDFICMRLCMSLCIGVHQCAQQPDNEYLGTDLDAVQRLLGELREIDPVDARATIFAG
ncbi:MAG: phosphotransferase [Gammaproteobacteria bacterium]|jgi:Ser/Thr protein kinase RdoA (MazF antagonist)